MAGVAAGANTQMTYRQNEVGDYVYHPNGSFRMSAQDATNANVANRAQRNESNAQKTGGVALTPVGSGPGGGGGYGGDGGSGGYGGGGGYGAGTVTGNPSSVVNSPGSAGGGINLSRPGYEDQQAMLLKAQLADKAFDRISGQFASGGGTGGHVSYGNSGAAEAARAAAFARAKEVAGQNAAAGMRTLEEVAGRRGIRGSSIEAGMIGDAVEGGRQDIANFNTNQLGEDLDYINRVSDTTYQGNITQRGQDQAAKQAMMSILAGLY